ncbi:MAG: helicase RepA family protein [Clostridia bacterium]|nr:helicase RepA family protein [Clostridia bacterium]
MDKDILKETTVINLEEDSKKKKKIRTISAQELQNKEFDPTTYIVDKVLPQGLSILAAPPKSKKSWFALDLCLSVSKGLPFLGFETRKSGCLYLALEDGEKRLKERVEKLLNNDTAPSNFNFTTEIPGLSSGLIDYLDLYIIEHPDTKLIVIDTLQKVRENAYGSQNVYAGDYRDMSAIKNLADKYNICILLIHHLRKSKDDSDSFNMISGSTAILGAVDTAYVFTKNKREDIETKWSITGRDIVENDYIISFNNTTCKWELIGNKEELQEQQKVIDYLKDPVVKVIKHLVESEYAWFGSAQQLLDVCQRHNNNNLSYTPVTLSKHLRNIKELLKNQDDIEYTPPPENGKNGRRDHTFRPIE